MITLKNYRKYSNRIVVVEPVKEQDIDILVTDKDDPVPNIAINDGNGNGIDIPINRAHQIAKILNALGDAFNADEGKDAN